MTSRFSRSLGSHGRLLTSSSRFFSGSLLHSSTLQSIERLSGPKSTLLLSYVDAALTDEPASVCGPGYPVEQIAHMVSRVAQAGEPWITSFSKRAGIADFLSAHCSFRPQSDTSVDELNSRYFEPLGRTIEPAKLLMVERYVVALKT